MSEKKAAIYFAPELIIPNGIKDISFYVYAFQATETFCFTNEDDSIHVAELNINGAIFHVHEVSSKKFFSPDLYQGCTCCIGLFVEDVHAVMQKAIQAGAMEIDPVTDYEYGYRQGMIKDPFGHYWQIQKKI